MRASPVPASRAKVYLTVQQVMDFRDNNVTSYAQYCSKTAEPHACLNTFKTATDLWDGILAQPDIDYEAFTKFPGVTQSRCSQAKLEKFAAKFRRHMEKAQEAVSGEEKKKKSKKRRRE